MYVLLLLLLLAVNPQNEVDKHALTKHKTGSATAKSKSEPSPAVPVNAPSNEPHPQTHPEHDQNKSNGGANRIEIVQQSDWWFKSYVIATLIIAAINWGMLVAIRRQRKVMGDQLGEMKAAREQTVAEMQAAGEQTKEVIGQAKMQAETLGTLATSMSTSANAATKSANALAHSERAWVYPELTPADPSKYAYNMVVTNFGRTLGKIETVRIGFACINPYEKPKPPFEFGLNFPEENALILPTQPIVLRKIILTDYFSAEWNAIGLGQKQAIVFAAIEYRDMIGESHESFMCYSYSVVTFQLEDLRFCRKYI